MAFNLFPAVDDEFNFPPQIREQLAKSPELRFLVVPMTQAQRDNLTEDELWLGRTIFNLSFNTLQTWVGTDPDPWVTYSTI